MTSNYDAIRDDNIRRRGEEFDDVGELLANRLYSNQMHFVYELLQNAQDALKKRSDLEPSISFPKKVHFSLFKNHLELRHFGQPFDENDVKGISDILRGTKSSDEKQIGKFGIGFKSVYAFTDSPEIHSGDEHFVVERYIRPRSAESVTINPGETLFIFPFNKNSIEPNQTYERIRNRLADLGLRSLLFLDEIDEIVWDLEGNRSGAYIRERKKIQEGIWRVTLLGEEGSKTSQEDWLIFRQPVADSKNTVEIAFYLGQDEKSKKYYIQPIAQSSLYVYFATDKETRLHFLIQGHYQTTPSRDNVLEDNEFNILLISETAKLLIRSLEYMKSIGLLNANTLETMPLKSEHFPPTSFFYPIFEEFRKAMMTLDLLPTVDGKFIKAEEAKLARGSELIRLLPSENLKALFLFSKDYQWLSDDITIDKTPDLREYILGSLGIEEIYPERFARQITPQFLDSQSNEWFIKFFEFLNGQRALWRPKYYNIEEGVLRSKPFIRRENGSLTTPFGPDGNALVYLPGVEETDFPTVKREIAQNEESLLFLKNLGLEEPDIVAEVLTYVLPKYLGEKQSLISDKEHILHIKKISNALKFSSGDKRQRLSEQLQKTSFLRGIQPGNPTRVYVRPSQMYIDDEILRNYYDGNPDVWFFDPIYLQYIDLLDSLGVERKIHMEHNQHAGKSVTLSDWPHIRGENGFDPDWKVDGLSFAVVNPTAIRSRIIWDEILRPNKHLIRGEIERSNRKDYSRSTKENKLSKVGELLVQNEWLPSKDGTFHMPSELSLDDLPEDFFRDEELSNQLGMKGITTSAFARESKIEESLFNLGLEVMKLAPDLFKEFALSLLKIQVNQGTSKNANFVTELEDKFSNLGVEEGDEEVEEENEEPPNIIIPNPERRRELSQEEILAEILTESGDNLRFKLMPIRVTEEKDKSVREFLYQMYKGKCQICGETFQKRNGRFYFEGLYLVSRLNVQWADRPGNVLCLCANCCAKFQYGQLIIENLKGQILNTKMKNEGGNGQPGIIIDLCGETQEIRYTERHMLDLQEMIKASMII